MHEKGPKEIKLLMYRSVRVCMHIWRFSVYRESELKWKVVCGISCMKRFILSELSRCKHVGGYASFEV